MIKKYLSQPYPQLNNKWTVIIAISSFIAIFMLIFQPFGLREYQASNKIFIVVGYGFVSFLILVFNLMLLPKFVKKWFELKKWTILKQIFWLTWIVFTIGAANYTYSLLIFPQFLGVAGFLVFQIFTLSVGIIPIIIITIVNQNQQLAYNLKEANDFNKKTVPIRSSNAGEKTICLIADNEKDKVEIVISDLIYIESEGNYVQVFYVEAYKLKNILLRSSLKRVEGQLSEFILVVKCHRAFMVNVNQIIQVKGNSQGLRLAVNYTDFEIPVSRNYAKNLKDKMNSR